MNKFKDEEGFINLNDINLKNIKSHNLYKNISFEYNNKIYYYKRCKKFFELYNEIIAEEIAKDFDLNYVHYDLAIFNDDYGVISENFIKDNYKYYTLEDIIKTYYNDDIDKHNNLIDIKKIFNLKGNENYNILFKEYLNIFIFDIIIGNMDRHLNNLIIEEINNNKHFLIFDNEEMLNNDSINYGIYSIGIDENDFHYCIDEYNYEDNFILKFLIVFNDKNIICDKLYILEKEYIINLLKKIENERNIKIDINLKKYLINKFEKNKKMIEKNINKFKTKKIL